jgi:tRNA nucleotidyltransferase/poly(A) polymerase
MTDLDARCIRAVSESIFLDDPLRLLRAVRIEDELGFRMDDHTEERLRASSDLVTVPAGERILSELRRLSADGYRRLAEVGLLELLGGRLDAPLDAMDDPDFRLVAVFRTNSRSFRSRTTSADTPRRSFAPGDRRIRHRERSIAFAAIPSVSLHALAFVGAAEVSDLVEAARLVDPAERWSAVMS